MSKDLVKICSWKVIIERDFENFGIKDYTHQSKKRVCLVCDGYNTNCQRYIPKTTKSSEIYSPYD